ncbi:SDR family oxidoreductase [Novosphingobium sp. 9]|uniref:SDR family oxidoreductase n=1 Tax=Novosphingobium sp. 9 TaxID=2025349 RepID=UPI0021B6D27F|nr:SDR family oxidoreductase [Novosphingobium sp. 9]
MNIFIVGGAGKVARRLIPLLAAKGHTPRALHRHPEQASELLALGGEPVAGDLTALDAAALAALMAGSDAVVFSAGAGGAGIELTNAVDGKGLETAVAAARMAGITRFLLVSAFPEAGRGTAPREGFENYMRVKKLADAHLAASDLDWVILRPGTLTLEPGTGRVEMGVALPYGSVTRDDVAAVLAALVETPQIRRRIIELTEGAEPASAAVQRLAHEWG